MIYRITIVALSAFENYSAISDNENDDAESTIKNVPPSLRWETGTLLYLTTLPPHPLSLSLFPTRKVHRPRTLMICTLMERAPPSFTAPFSSDRRNLSCLLRATTTTMTMTILRQNGDPCSRVLRDCHIDYQHRIPPRDTFPRPSLASRSVVSLPLPFDRHARLFSTSHDEETTTTTTTMTAGAATGSRDSSCASVKRTTQARTNKRTHAEHNTIQHNETHARTRNF